MTRQIDPTKPPTHTTGADHYQRAERLLADAETEIAETGNWSPATLVAIANVHAQLAAIGPWPPLQINVEASADEGIDWPGSDADMQRFAEYVRERNVTTHGKPVIPDGTDLFAPHRRPAGDNK